MSALRPTGSTRAWRNLRAVVLDRDGHVCQIRTPGVCVLWANHVDHVLPRWAGGSDDLGNLRAACRPCNLDRGRAILSAGRADTPAPLSKYLPKVPRKPTVHRRLWPEGPRS